MCRGPREHLQHSMLACARGPASQHAGICLICMLPHLRAEPLCRELAALQRALGEERAARCAEADAAAARASTIESLEVHARQLSACGTSLHLPGASRCSVVFMERCRQSGLSCPLP